MPKSVMKIDCRTDPVLIQTDAKNEMLRVLGMEKQND